MLAMISFLAMVITRLPGKGCMVSMEAYTKDNILQFYGKER
jgi:hypothetical protein